MGTVILLVYRLFLAFIPLYLEKKRPKGEVKPDVTNIGIKTTFIKIKTENLGIKTTFTNIKTIFSEIKTTYMIFKT